MASNPRDTIPLRLDQEIREIDEGLRRSRNREQFILEQRWAVRPRDIARAMHDVNPQIMHFSGHGKGPKADLEEERSIQSYRDEHLTEKDRELKQSLKSCVEEGLVFEDETGQAQLVSGTALEGLFKLFLSQVECVVLNACYSAVQAKAIAQHVPYVVGMKRDVGDKAAISFSVGFYDALGAGRSIEDAFEFGRNAVQLEGIPEHLTPKLVKKEGVVAAQNFPPAVTLEEELSKSKAIEVFFSYAQKDEALRDELATHLSMMKRQGVIKAWHDREILGGREWAGAIDQHLNTAQVILLLVSPDFIDSDYCYDIEVRRAMERHQNREAVVIPILLRPVDWKGSPFEKLQPLPKNYTPVTQWNNRDEAFLNIVKGIREVANWFENY